MSATLLDYPRWTGRRWWIVLGLVFGTQMALLFWLADNRPIQRRAPAVAPQLELVPRHTELLALHDPTLFALPHEESFSGLAWLKTKPPVFPPWDWTEEPRWLKVAETQLGAAFNQLTETNLGCGSPPPPMPAPELAVPETSAPGLWRERSRVRVEGELVNRRLLSSFHLPSWRHVDLLTNSIVQVVVTGEGRPLSVFLLGGSGYQPADDYALEQAKGARFTSLGDTPEILSQPLAHLSWGQLIFEWLTLPSTNPPTAGQ